MLLIPLSKSKIFLQLLTKNEIDEITLRFLFIKSNSIFSEREAIFLS